MNFRLFVYLCCFYTIYRLQICSGNLLLAKKSGQVSAFRVFVVSYDTYAIECEAQIRTHSSALFGCNHVKLMRQFRSSHNG